MVWKSLVVTFLAVGLCAAYEVSDEHKQQFNAMIAQACKKNGAEDKTTEVENAVKSFVDCVKELFDPETIKKEIEEAKPKGALDEVFKKYCEKSDQLKTCIHTASSAVMPCVDSKISEHLPEIQNGTNQLIDFVCYKDGDRIALFIAEYGPECFQEKVNEIRACADTIKGSVTNVEEAKKLSLQEQCGKLDDLTKCVVTSLESCSTPTPGNMADALFKYVRKASPCKDVAVKA